MRLFHLVHLNPMEGGPRRRSRREARPRERHRMPAKRNARKRLTSTRRIEKPVRRPRRTRPYRRMQRGGRRGRGPPGSCAGSSFGWISIHRRGRRSGDASCGWSAIAFLRHDGVGTTALGAFRHAVQKIAWPVRSVETIGRCIGEELAEFLLAFLDSASSTIRNSGMSLMTQ